MRRAVLMQSVVSFFLIWRYWDYVLISPPVYFKRVADGNITDTLDYRIRLLGNLFGTMIEGETAAFLSGIAAPSVIILSKVMLVAALGGIISDNVLFYRLFCRKPDPSRIHKHADKICPSATDNSPP